MKEKKRVLWLIGIMAGGILSVTGIAIGLLYEASVRQQQQRLVETVQSEARMIEALARNIASRHPAEDREKILATTVDLVTEAHENYEKGGLSAEFTMARRMGHLIVFLIKHRHDNLKTPSIVKWGVGLAEPMQAALSGRSGTLFGHDYRGVRVLAAYEPVNGMGLGIVAKIDVSELRIPFIRAGMAAVGVALVAVLGGTALFLRITGPMVRDLQEHSRRLAESNARLNREVMERRAAQQALSHKAGELEVLNEELAQYARIVSHDLKAPLRAISNYASFLKEDLSASLADEPSEYLEALQESAGEAIRLVNDLLALAGVESRTTEGSRFDPADFLRKLIDSMALPASVSIESPEAWPEIEADSRLFRQIFQNLIENAVKFNTSPAKEVVIGWRPLDSGDGEFFVRDNGIGIDPADHERIFNMLQRLHPRDAYDGSGIGLAIAKKAASKIGGSIRIESSPGKGSTFFIRFPVVADTATT